MGRLPAMDNGIERQTVDAGQEILAKKAKAKQDRRAWCIILTGSLVFTVCFIAVMQYFGAQVHYSVAIDSVSGLDPTVGLSFNLTLGVASRSYGAKACIDPVMYLEVFYHGTQLAASEAESGRLCTGPRKAAELPVVARATGVPVGHVLDNLAADMKQDVAMFEITLHVPAGSYGGIASQYPIRWVSECKGRQVGEAAAPCNSPGQDPMFG